MRRIPFEFVLEEIAALEPWHKPMFGCTAVYADDKIYFALRDRPTHPEDNGVWIATTREHHASLRKELPCMRSISAFTTKSGDTGWQVLPADDPGFEEAVLRACALVRARDPRIGKVPATRATRGALTSRRAGSRRR